LPFHPLSLIEKSAVVPYSADEMYALVNDIESYPRFLPWCTEARILEPGEREQTASVSLASGPVRQTFTTRNTMQPGRRIDVRLLSGPFSRLNGRWEFDPQGERDCRIAFRMEFEFKNRLLRLSLQKVFHLIVNSLVESFTRRAEQLHGRR